MHYTDHAKISARKFGGMPKDYMHLHKLMDSTKHHFPHYMHRVFSHNTWFVQVLDDLLGPTITNSDNQEISVRDILHAHLREDHSDVAPTIQDWLENLRLEPTEKGKRWVNRPDPKELYWLQQQKPNTENI